MTKVVIVLARQSAFNDQRNISLIQFSRKYRREFALAKKEREKEKRKSEGASNLKVS